MDQFKINGKYNFSGVYCIMNLNNNKVYIGSSSTIQKRLINHKTLLKNGKSKIKEMQEDYNKGHKFIAFVIVQTRKRLTKYNIYEDGYVFEKMAINVFNSTNPEKGYNTINNRITTTYEQYKIEWAKNFYDSYVYNKKRFYNKSAKEDLKMLATYEI